MTFRSTSLWLGGSGVTAPHDQPRLVLSERPPAGGRWRQEVTSSTIVDSGATDGAISDRAGEDARPGEARPRHLRLPMATADHPVSVARRAVRAHCRGRVADAVVDDLMIVVSELVANVLEHGGGANGLTLELTIRATEVDVQVIGHGDRHRLPPSGDWRLPPPTQRTGRGLALVRRLACWVTVDGDGPVRDQDGWIAITAALPISAA